MRFVAVCCWNTFENDKIKLFQPRQLPFVSIPSIVFIRSVGGSEKNRFVGDEMRMQTWRQTELPQMIEITTACSHVEGQVLYEVCHRLVGVFLWQLFPDDMRHFVLNDESGRSSQSTGIFGQFKRSLKTFTFG